MQAPQDAPHTILPGTTLAVNLAEPDAVEHTLSMLFLAGGLVLSQVCSLTGLEPYIVQNWVKRGFLSPPVDRKYGSGQFSRIALINALKDCLHMDGIVRLLSSINGMLGSESDDIVDDMLLYTWFVRLVCDARVQTHTLLAAYEEPFPGARGRLAEGLEIMALAYRAARYKKQAEERLAKLAHDDSRMGGEEVGMV